MAAAVVCVRCLLPRFVRRHTGGLVRCLTDSSGSSKDQGTSNNGEDVKTRVLKSSLKFVSSHGWTTKALAAGAEEEGLPFVAHGMFPRGGADLVHFFYEQSNLELGVTLEAEVEAAEEDSSLKKRTGPFVRDAIEARLRMVIPYVDSWPKAMALMVLPENAPEAWRNLLRLSDTIWYHAGDRSTNTDWYTKRLSLAAVYKSTEIYLLQDKSDHYQDTWTFLDRRLSDVTKAGKAISQVNGLSSVLRDGFWGASHVTMNILGMNTHRR